MICKKPIYKNGTGFGCGQCQPCRINKRRVWAHRMMLESLCHRQNAFVTLILSDEYLSLVSSVKTRIVRPTLDKSLVPGFLKRLRAHLDPMTVRFFAVGEYGEKKERPHYHLILYSYPSCSRGRTLRKVGTTEPDAEHCCEACNLLWRKWGMGNVDVGDVTLASCSYCAEYTLKKMTKADDSRLEGRIPEFTLQSRRPGIGAPAMWDIASSMMQTHLDDYEKVPIALDHGRRSAPLGRFMRNKIRVGLGWEEGMTDVEKEAQVQEMRAMQQASIDDPDFYLKQKEERLQKALNVQSRENIHKARKSL